MFRGGTIPTFSPGHFVIINRRYNKVEQKRFLHLKINFLLKSVIIYTCIKHNTFSFLLIIILKLIEKIKKKMEKISQLTNDELYEKLKHYGIAKGPVTSIKI